MFVPTRLLLDVLSVTPAIRENCRSSGVATAVAMVSGAAPGRFALTLIVGYSTCGRGATGRKANANAPTMASAIVSSDVATGLLMNGVEMLMCYSTATSSLIRFPIRRKRNRDAILLNAR